MTLSNGKFAPDSSPRLRKFAFRLTLLLGLAIASLAQAQSAAVSKPAPRTIPTPEQSFGFRPGADYKLADYPMIVSYYRKLAAAVPERIRILEIGPTAKGQQMIMAIVSSRENLRQLDRYREISRRLVLTRGLTEAQARELARQGKAIIWIDSGLHASEVASAQHAPELAYRVLTEETPEMQFIRENVILLQVPVMNPDGLNLIADWYKTNVGTPYELADMPWLYHIYVGHDNNRDWYAMSQPETRNVARLLYQEWFPQIVYNHHQAGPFPSRIFVPPFDEPMNPNIPPLVMRGVHLVGDAMTTRFEKEGKAGAVSRMGFDTWWNGGMRTAPYFHNMVGILTETALYKYATPRFYKPEEIPKSFRDGVSAQTPSSSYPHPWLGGWWHLRDAVEYMLTASMAVLDIGARLREDWLYNIYQMGRWAIDAGEKGGPYGYVIPKEQWDPGSAAEMLSMLQLGGIEVQQAKAEFVADGKRYPAGSHVILAAQPFRAYVIDLLEPQKYPDLREYAGGPPKRPYDMTGWTLPLQMGVNVARVDKLFSAELEPVDTVPAPVRQGEGYVSRRENASFRLVNQALKAEKPVWVAVQQFSEGEPGTFIVGQAAPPEAKALKQRAPRIALYQSWVANIDEGWTRWLLEQYGFSYTTLHDADIRAGNLAAKFDCVILPQQEFRSLLLGNQPGDLPAEEFVNGPREPIVQRPEYFGGMGLEGAEQLKEFVLSGGTLIAMDTASNLPIQLFGIPVRNVLAGVSNREFYAPGSLFHVQVTANDPLTYGLPKEIIAFFVNSPAFEAFRDAKVLASYPQKDVLASGWILGEPRVAGRGAVIEAPLGKGRVVLIGFRCQFRGQPRATFKVLFNAIYSSTLEHR